jgi:hypothetical protein
VTVAVDKLAQLPGLRWRHPRVRQPPHPQHIRQIGGVALIFHPPIRKRLHLSFVK